MPNSDYLRILGPLLVASSISCAQARSLADADVRVADWRVVDDEAGVPLAIARCPKGPASCERELSFRPGESILQISRSPDGRSLGLFRLSADARRCEVIVCDAESCGRAMEEDCNPNNGSLRWLPTAGLLYRGGAGSGISVAALMGRDGTELWSSAHDADELSPSGRYLLVGDAEGIRAVELVKGEVVGSVRVPPDEDVRAVWRGDGVRLSWQGGQQDLSLRDSGTLVDDSSGWRPYSGAP